VQMHITPNRYIVHCVLKVLLVKLKAASWVLSFNTLFVISNICIHLILWHAPPERIAWLQIMNMEATILYLLFCHWKHSEHA
jgi:hypothetical protein